jgi:hypothetical protein
MLVERTPYETRQLDYLCVAVALAYRVHHAPLYVVLEDEERNLFGGGGERVELLHDFGAIAVLFNHTLDATRLALDTAHSTEQGVFVLLVMVLSDSGAVFGRRVSGGPGLSGHC